MVYLGKVCASGCQGWLKLLGSEEFTNFVGILTIVKLFEIYFGKHFCKYTLSLNKDKQSSLI